jgi:hypothetical protein
MEAMVVAVAVAAKVPAVVMVVEAETPIRRTAAGVAMV